MIETFQTTTSQYLSNGDDGSATWVVGEYVGMSGIPSGDPNNPYEIENIPKITLSTSNMPTGRPFCMEFGRNAGGRYIATEESDQTILGLLVAYQEGLASAIGVQLALWYLENNIPLDSHPQVITALNAAQSIDTTGYTYFKWNRGYNPPTDPGNETGGGGRITDNVNEAGGNTNAVLRFSIQWNDIAPDFNDLDAHCIEPDGSKIGYEYRVDDTTGGTLDVDNVFPTENVSAVENIVWADESTMLNGIYQFYVHNFTHNGGETGFRSEIEFDGQRYEINYNKNIRQGEAIKVAEVSLQDGTFSLTQLI